MFTGIVQSLGRVQAFERGPQGARLTLTVEAAWSLEPGESVAVNGCCLTVLPGTGLSFDLSPETLQRSSLGKLRSGDAVNLERALRAGEALGGHLVAGHVDGLAHLEKVTAQDDGRLWRLSVPQGLARYIAEKGSVCLDGVSLTPHDVQGASFSVSLIPHTLNVTALGSRREGEAMNLEVDLIARYLDRLLEARTR